MSQHTVIICRLCTSKQMLKDLYKTDGLSFRTSSCIGIMLHPDDGLSPLICEVCEQTINNFYNFKQNCLDIDSRLRSSFNSKELLENTGKTIKQECELLDNDLENNYIEPWLEDQKHRASFHEEYICNNSGDEKTDINDIDKPLTTTFPKYGIKRTKETDNGILKCEKLLCEQCGNMFKSKQILEKHSVTHTGLRMFSCKLCPKKFTRAAHRVVHMRQHMGIRPYTCEICGKSSIKRQDLNRHLRIHSDEKRYPCLQCDKRFKRSGDVHAHMRTHTGARPAKCSYCEKCYTSHSGLKKHLYRSHCKKDVK